jgi:glycosyltransferase involved in cell wall biosynthesis
MMAASVHLLVPGPLEQRTGGYIYDRRIVLGLHDLGIAVAVHELSGCFPLIDDAARRSTGAVLAALPPGGLPLIDGLAFPAVAEQLDRLQQPFVALVHHPLALETGLSAAQAGQLAAAERRVLAAAARVIVTSPGTRADLAGYDVDPARVGVVLPGTEPAPLARGSGGAELALLCVASLTARKGHLVLLEALAALADLPWRLTCIGSPERDPATAAAIAASIEAHGLAARVALVGEQDEAALQPWYDAADAFVLASHHEGYGMVLAEALARGLPIVSTSAGAIPQTVPAAAGILVPPGDPPALAAALRRLIGEPELRRKLAAGAQAARAGLPDWRAAAQAFAAELAQAAGAR